MAWKNSKENAPSPKADQTLTRSSARLGRSDGPDVASFIAVSMRRQTPQEARHFDAALQLLLTELVRQQLQGKERTS